MTRAIASRSRSRSASWLHDHIIVGKSGSTSLRALKLI
jgi:DNA repair protein RadC